MGLGEEAPGGEGDMRRESRGALEREPARVGMRREQLSQVVGEVLVTMSLRAVDASSAGAEGEGEERGGATSSASVRARARRAARGA